LRIEGELTIYQVADLKPSLLAELDQYSALEIDLSAVTEIDTAGFQLLMAAKKSAESRGKKLILSRHSVPVLDVFELLDLGAYFGDPIVI
jgi:anti-anti-sigma factor